MLYINDPEQPYKTYDEVVNIAIANGVEPKRVYIYLAMMGVTSAPARVVDSSGVDYMDPVKMAVKDKKLVTNIRVCGHCKGFVIE